MNRHLKMARGVYIAVHGSGDIALPERLAKQYRFLEDNDEVQVVSCRVRRIGDDGEVTFPDKGCGTVAHDDLIERNRFYHGEVMYRRAYLKIWGAIGRFFEWVPTMTYGWHDTIRPGVLLGRSPIRGPFTSERTEQGFA